MSLNPVCPFGYEKNIILTVKMVSVITYLLTIFAVYDKIFLLPLLSA